MVPMFGAIMPEPLQIPATEKPSPRTRACFSTRSVVMIARAAAASAPSDRASEPARPAACRSIRGRSRYRPMTPVEATPTSRSSTPRARPPIAAIAAASSRPRWPVWAFAQPELAMIPPSRPRRIRSIISSIGGCADQVRGEDAGRGPLGPDQGEAVLALSDPGRLDPLDRADRPHSVELPPGRKPLDDVRAGHDPDELGLAHHGKADDPLPEHQRGRILDRSLLADRDRGLAHHAADGHGPDVGERGLGLLPVDELADRHLDDLERRRQPEVLRRRPGREQGEQVRVGHHADEPRPLEDGQPADVVLPHEPCGLADARVRLDRERVQCHDIADLHDSPQGATPGARSPSSSG